MSCGEKSCGSKTPGNVGVDRRGFLAAIAGAAAITLGPGLTLYTLGKSGEAFAKAADQPVTDKTRWGLLIDISKCEDGCTACVTACSDEMGWENNGLATDPQWIRKVSITDPKNGMVKTAPVMCQHCAEPPCVDVCPTGASFKRDDGIVLVDKHICIGCRYCMMACPYAARSFVHEKITDQKSYMPRGKGTVESCTMCVHRVDNDRLPACVEACATKGEAMIFGDLNDPDSDISKIVATYATTRIRDDLRLDTGVYYRNL